MGQQQGEVKVFHTGWIQRMTEMVPSAPSFTQHTVYTAMVVGDTEDALNDYVSTIQKRAG